LSPLTSGIEAGKSSGASTNSKGPVGGRVKTRAIPLSSRRPLLQWSSSFYTVSSEARL
jgi:hypothetical protein